MTRDGSQPPPTQHSHAGDFNKGGSSTGGATRYTHVLAVTIFALAYILLGSIGAIAEPNYPALTGRIVDNAGLIQPADRAEIERELVALEGAATDQVAVVTVPTLDGYPIEDYAIGLARKWQLGQKNVDNGVLFLIAPNDRKVRIEVGRRLEPIITDTMAALIIENAILPQFRRGDYSSGIRDGVRDIKALLLGDAEAVKQRLARRVPKAEDLTPYLHIALLLAIYGFFIWQHYRQRQRRRGVASKAGPEQRQRKRRRSDFDDGFVIFPSDFGRGGGWSGGGGGWSGGGGGFGGGGASGSW